MNILMLDKDKEFLISEEKIIKNWVKDLGIKVHFVLSTKIDIEYISTFDLIIMDVYLNKYSGLDVSKAVYAKNKRSKIIFLTSFVLRADEACYPNVMAFRYKKDMKDTLVSALDIYYHHNKKKKIPLMYGDRSVSLEIDHIYYIEICCREIFIHTKSNRFRIRGNNLRAYVQELNEHQFKEISQSCYVNYDHISKIDQNRITLDNDKILYISRRKIKRVKESFLLWHS